MENLFCCQGSSGRIGSSSALQFYRKYENQRKKGLSSSGKCKEEGGAALMTTESLACDSVLHLRTM